MHKYILLCKAKSAGAKTADNSVRVTADNIDTLAKLAVEKLGTAEVTEIGLYQDVSAKTVAQKIASLAKKE